MLSQSITIQVKVVHDDDHGGDGGNWCFSALILHLSCLGWTKIELSYKSRDKDFVVPPCLHKSFIFC